ncbi:nickel transporter [Pseudolabrys sp. Root1462]|uniref:nickel/cobalt transporter n=1 Tax=Pseudolabrys sp. Root1462 TaxID=1736466 RepID=UPI0007032121|nr:nickel/cobalt transporter [Pseudolabrys sp. Root1462]KQZ02195.1 nickel transporter [Pseudolabrys sp. Root1462]
MPSLPPRFRVSQPLLFIAAVALIAATVDAASAAPFGMSAGGPPAPVGGLAGWILMQQATFYRMLSGAIRAAKADGTAAIGLMGISFAYGVFHAAGPGHGKAVISSYLVANNETWKRGIALSFVSAVLQSFTAIAIVAIAAVLLGATSKVMGDTVRVVETVSYALIVVIGLRLTWVKGKAFLKLLMPQPQPALAHAHAGGHDDGHAHSHSHHAHDHAHDHDHAHGHVHTAACAHGHHHDHDHDDEGHAWGHAHAPEPSELTGKHWLRRGLAAVFAVGLRPCSGAIIVLVFALAQGLFWVGVASTFVMGLGTAITVSIIATLAVIARGFAGRIAASKSGGGMLLLRGFEAAAAVLIVAFGVLLLTGYMVSERMIGV